jgi:hypothetical protein
MTFPDFEEFIECLNGERVRFLLVGGYAVAYHGHPRATKDLDVLLDATPTNAERALRAFRRFLGTTRGITKAKLLRPRTLVVLGVAPVRIDVLTSIAGVNSFAAAYARRASGKLGRSKAAYLGLEDLLAAKVASGRLQDLADVEALRRLAKSVRDVRPIAASKTKRRRQAATSRTRHR